VTAKTSAQSTYTLEISEADDKLVRDVWKDFIKNKYNARPKWDRKNKQWVAEEVRIAGVDQPVTLYSSIDQRGKDATLKVWYETESGDYVMAKAVPAEYGMTAKGGERTLPMLNEVALEIKREKIRRQLEEEKKELDKLESELKRLQRDNDRYHRIIEKAREQIAEAEQDIIQNLKEQEQKAKQIEAQKEEVSQVKETLEKTNN
ncbi:MAG: hypothetical protein R3350_01805, partial [Saprospiraceae bacterium]|nr:hypothetical protein [Saprospiraceae bacterium]